MIKYFLPLILLLFTQCNAPKREAHKNILYLTTNASDIYAFDLKEKKLKWHIPGINQEVNDEVTYFSINGNVLTKIYQDASIIQYNKKDATELAKIQDAEDESQSYYGYDFTEVDFLLFNQYPLVYNGNTIFGNSHGEIKSVNIQTKKTNWVYIQPQIIYSSPKIFKNAILANVNYGMVLLDGKTGKKIKSANYDKDEPITNELMIDENKIYGLSQYNMLSCFDSKLNPMWKYKTEEAEISQSSTHNLLFDEENVYFGGETLFAVNKNNGKLKWKTALYTNEQPQNSLLSVAKSDDGVFVMTRNEILKINKSGKITARFSLKTEAMGMLMNCNEMYYFLDTKGTLYSIDKELKNLTVFYDKINIDLKRGVENSYFYAE